MGRDPISPENSPRKEGNVRTGWNSPEVTFWRRAPGEDQGLRSSGPGFSDPAGLTWKILPLGPAFQDGAL